MRGPGSSSRDSIFTEAQDAVTSNDAVQRAPLQENIPSARPKRSRSITLPHGSGSEEARGTGQPRAKAVRLKVLKDAGLGEPPRRSRGNGNEDELEERRELIH